MLRCGSDLRCFLAFVESFFQVGDVVAKGHEAGSGGRLSDEVAEEESEERIALEWREAHWCLRVLVESVEPLLGERVNGAFAGLARFASCLEVAELREPLWLDVVLAFSGPVEHPPLSRHPQEVVRARAAATDEAENLVREQTEFSA